MTKEELHELFNYHPPDTDERKAAHDAVNSGSLSLAHILVEVCPDSPELTLAIRSLHIARMQANAAIALYMPDKTGLSPMGRARKHERVSGNTKGPVPGPPDPPLPAGDRPVG
jgi:hypothetical protein